ncbi:MAG: haloacid dehalogenase-like hydrolase [Puniceicoccales bacterium]|jgi:hypothetical protein|nr:haloacid dehalogenase-like hydrolase [Puniceicoccales bacterium]
MNTCGSIIACIWDFDKTLIRGYMQAPLFREYGIDESLFWEEVDGLPSKLRKKGIHLSETLSYLNCVLKLVRMGRLPGLSKEKLMRYGQQLTFFPGIPEFFSILKEDIENHESYRSKGITLEHYVVSSGHCETIRGSKIAPWVEDIFASEFLGNEIGEEAKNFLEKMAKKRMAIEKGEDFFGDSDRPEVAENRDQILLQGIGDRSEEEPEKEREIEQIACAVDNTQKTRYLFEINKGSNKNSAISVNAKVRNCDRRIPFENMIYIADGPSDIPAFAVIRERGGKAFAVYDPSNEREFEQNDRMLAEERIDAYGPTDYRPDSPTAKWIRMHVQKIAKRIFEEREQLTEKRVGKLPEHLY